MKAQDYYSLLENNGQFLSAGHYLRAHEFIQREEAMLNDGRQTQDECSDNIEFIFKIMGVME